MIHRFRRLIAPALLVALVSYPAAAKLEVTALQVTPRLDLRAVGGNPADEALRIQQAEADVTLSLSNGQSEIASFAYQGVLETPMTGRARDMHFGNAYTVLNLGVGRPKVKLGQFVVPFGTLAEYDTHGIPLQTPYARTLGIRIDRGLDLEGTQGDWDYWASVTSGNGRGARDGGWAGIVRVARDYEWNDEYLRTGYSLLLGRQMPVFPTNAMSMPMGMDDMVSFHDKWRVATDLDWLHGIDNYRAELVVGADDGDRVDGQWLYYNHPFSYDADLTLQADRWRQADGTSLGVGAQYHHRLDDWSGWRLAWEQRWADRSTLSDLSSDTFTLQYYREWAWAPNL